MSELEKSILEYGKSDAVRLHMPEILAYTTSGDDYEQVQLENLRILGRAVRSHRTFIGPSDKERHDSIL